MDDHNEPDDNPHPWQTKGHGKKKQNRKIEKEENPADSEGSSSKRSRRTHKEGGNLRERKEIRESKKTKGFTNVTASTSTGINRLGPMYKPPTLVTKTAAKVLATGTGQGLAPTNTNSSPHTIADKQAQVKATYARMVQESTGKPYEVVVYKKDRSLLTREDQWTVQFGISNSILEATQAGKTGDQIAHSGTRLNPRNLSVFCGPKAGPFYKEALNKIAGFEAFLPEERKPGHEIFATLPGYVEPLLSRLPEHFAAGTFGAVKPNQLQEIGLFRYNTLRDNFNNNEWTMRNYLEFYNNNDVVPFLEAVENMCTYYKTRGVDIFKEAVSVPGVSLRLAFREMDQQQSFYLFNKRHSDLVDLFLSNNVGGPAIIFDRWQEVGKTTIRHNPRGKPTKTILGLDGVALYLWCTSQDMPCGFYVRRRSEKNFIKEYPTPISSVATEWLADLEHRQNTTIQHARNKGEFRLGSKQIPVDGFRMSDKTVFQFYGCWWHGCPKCKTDDRDVSTGGKTLNDKLKHTEKVEEYIKDCGYRLVTIWECEWKEYKRSHNIHNRAGDRDPSMKAIADTSKLIGNSFYGYTIMNKGKHQNVQFLNETDAIRAINNPRFVSLEEFEDSYEVTSKKRVIKYDLPVQIGFFVYQYAKLRMLNFYFDVVDRFVSREDYNMLEMDTDSLYMALSGTSLEEIVKPELRSEWERQKTIWFPSEENYAHDLREPGLFKVEWQGKGFVGLSAKTYFCFSDDPKHDKLSTKGVNKSAGITRSDFLRVKETKETIGQERPPTCFQAGRSTNDNLILMALTLDHFNDNPEDGGFILQADLEKAFDSVSHKFLFTVLQNMGFGNYLVNLIKIAFNGCMSFANVNGHLSSPIYLLRGLHQGSPLSPVLFLLVSQVLTKRLENNPDIRGLSISGVSVLTSLFADDTDLFMEATADSVDAAIHELVSFGRHSGCKPNINKTKCIPLGAARGEADLLQYLDNRRKATKKLCDQEQKVLDSKTSRREFAVGEKVLFWNELHKNWNHGTVKELQGSKVMVITTVDKQETRKHLDHVRKDGASCSRSEPGQNHSRVEEEPRLTMSDVKPQQSPEPVPDQSIDQEHDHKASLRLGQLESHEKPANEPVESDISNRPKRQIKLPDRLNYSKLGGTNK
ncbi:hypothetical protein ACHWQZ_G010240 [Mnemiopsis leidyi]